MTADEAGIRSAAAAMGAGESAPLFAGMLTQRPWDQVGVRKPHLESHQARTNSWQLLHRYHGRSAPLSVAAAAAAAVAPAAACAPGECQRFLVCRSIPLNHRLTVRLRCLLLPVELNLTRPRIQQVVRSSADHLRVGTDEAERERLHRCELASRDHGGKALWGLLMRHQRMCSPAGRASNVFRLKTPAQKGPPSLEHAHWRRRRLSLWRNGLSGIPATSHVLSCPDWRRCLRRSYARQFARDSARLLQQVPTSLLLLLKTNDCLRSVDKALGQVREAPNLY